MVCGDALINKVTEGYYFTSGDSLYSGGLLGVGSRVGAQEIDLLASE